MPRKPKRPCAHPGCPKLSDGRCCPEHRSVVDKHYNKYQRDPECNKRYGRAWKRIRDRQIRAHPICEMCEQNGTIVPAEEIHHILPLLKGGTHATSNLISLCKSCHSSITAKDGDRWG